MYAPVNRSQVQVLSVMRDLRTGIRGYGTRKINLALAFGGIPLVVQTIEGSFNQRIDHVAITDTDGVVNLTDALGGVGPDVPYTFNSYLMPIDTFTPGYRNSIVRRRWHLSANVVRSRAAAIGGSRTSRSAFRPSCRGC